MAGGKAKKTSPDTVTIKKALKTKLEKKIRKTASQASPTTKRGSSTKKDASFGSKAPTKTDPKNNQHKATKNLHLPQTEDNALPKNLPTTFKPLAWNKSPLEDREIPFASNFSASLTTQMNTAMLLSPSPMKQSFDRNLSSFIKTSIEFAHYFYSIFFNLVIRKMENAFISVLVVLC
jgi:hypothetical protein